VLPSTADRTPTFSPGGPARGRGPRADSLGAARAGRARGRWSANRRSPRPRHGATARSRTARARFARHRESRIRALGLLEAEDALPPARAEAPLPGAGADIRGADGLLGPARRGRREFPHPPWPALVADRPAPPREAWRKKPAGTWRHRAARLGARSVQRGRGLEHRGKKQKGISSRAFGDRRVGAPGPSANSTPAQRLAAPGRWGYAPAPPSSPYLRPAACWAPRGRAPWVERVEERVVARAAARWSFARQLAQRIRRRPASPLSEVPAQCAARANTIFGRAPRRGPASVQGPMSGSAVALAPIGRGAAPGSVSWVVRHPPPYCRSVAGPFDYRRPPSRPPRTPPRNLRDISASLGSSFKIVHWAPQPKDVLRLEVPGCDGSSKRVNMTLTPLHHARTKAGSAATGLDSNSPRPGPCLRPVLPQPVSSRPPPSTTPRRRSSQLDGPEPSLARADDDAPALP